MTPDRSKIGKSNVLKGKTHERRVANLLTEYSGVQFRRRRVEGRDLSVVERESTADVIPVAAEVHFSIEAKSGKGFSFDALLGNPQKNLFTTWWHQAAYDAEILTSVLKRKIHPMLFFKYSVTQDWVVVPTESFEVLKHKEAMLNMVLPNLVYKYSCNPISLNVKHTSKKKNHVEVILNLPDVCFMRWKDFIEYIEPTSLFFKKTEV
jgi:hypothetical protein